MPVYERPVWILFPCPDVKGVEGGQPEPVGRLEVVKELAHEFGWRSGVSFVPGIGQDKEVRPGQPGFATGIRLIDDDLRMGRIERACSHQCEVHIMKSHRSRV